MSTTYAQKQAPTQKKDAPTAASILDTSSQSESLQRKADMANKAAQREEAPRPNNTGMPDNLKAGIESLSGFSMDDVRVHYNSSKPATVQALAYTQGTDIHVAPGQEKHLPHEAWHVAQQMAGRVSPTTNINGMPVNDNAGLEHEADVMGEKAVQRKGNNHLIGKGLCPPPRNNPIQCAFIDDYPSRFLIGGNNQSEINTDTVAGQGYIYSSIRKKTDYKNQLYNNCDAAMIASRTNARTQMNSDYPGILPTKKNMNVRGRGDAQSGPEKLDVILTPQNEYWGYGYAYHPTDENNKMLKVLLNGTQQTKKKVKHYHSIKQKLNSENRIIDSQGNYIPISFSPIGKYESIGDIEHYLTDPF